MCSPRPPRQTPPWYSVLEFLTCSVLTILLEYVTGDRFSPEFMERRRLECVLIALYKTNILTTYIRLHRFLERLSRHPTLQRSTLLRAFFESTEWVCFR